MSQPRELVNAWPQSGFNGPGHPLLASPYSHSGPRTSAQAEHLRHRCSSLVPLIHCQPPSSPPQPVLDLPLWLGKPLQRNVSGRRQSKLWDSHLKHRQANWAETCRRTNRHGRGLFLLLLRIANCQWLFFVPFMFIHSLCHF